MDFFRKNELEWHLKENQFFHNSIIILRHLETTPDEHLLSALSNKLTRTFQRNIRIRNSDLREIYYFLSKNIEQLEGSQNINDIVLAAHISLSKTLGFSFLHEDPQIHGRALIEIKNQLEKYLHKLDEDDFDTRSKLHIY